MTDLTLVRKYRIVKSYGKISRQKNNKYKYESYSFRNSPVLSMENRSQWKLVTDVFEIIKDYG